MAKRPVFFTTSSSKIESISEEIVEFDWYPGFSISQKQKSILSLHQNIIKLNSLSRPLEISSKSPLSLGVQLSAFNLCIKFKGSIHFEAPIESIYQSSKEFSGFINNDPRRFYLSPKDARKRTRYLESTYSLVGWSLDSFKFDLKSGTKFYDWLYVGALSQQPHLLNQICEFDCFTDIEFNPRKSLACQARSAALARQLFLAEGSLYPYLKRISTTYSKKKLDSNDVGFVQHELSLD